MSSELFIGEADRASARTGPWAEATRILAGVFGAREPVAEKEGPAGGAPPEGEGATVVRIADWRGLARGGAGRFAPAMRAGRSLGETARLLREAAGPLWPGVVGEGSGPAGPEIPAGARFEARRFACAEGGRDYRLYVPASLAAIGAPRGLVLMLHGCKQTPEDFALGTGMNDQAEREGLILVYPRQVAARNASRCWNWFRASDQGRGRGEPAILAAMARAVAGEFGVPPGRVFVAGLSAGGAMAAVLSEAYPDVFAAAGIHSGVATGAARDVASAIQAMRGEWSPGAARPGGGRRIVFQGVEDTTVHPVNAARLLPAGIEAAPRRVGRTGGGRVYQCLALGGTKEGAAPESELWLVEAAGHAWSGGRAPGSFTDPDGPDASAEMARFFLGRPWAPAAHC